MKAARLALLLALCAGSAGSGAGRAYAQAHTLEARAMLGTVSARDDTLVPIAFTGPALALGVHYAADWDRDTLGAEFDFGFGAMFERWGHLAAQLPHTLALDYTHALQHDTLVRLDLGVGLRWQDEITFFASWDDAHGYWLSTLALGPVLRYSHHLAHGLWLEGRGELALVGLASRSPAYRWNKQDALTHVTYHLDRIFDDAEPFWLLDVQQIRLEALARFRTAQEARGAGWGLGVFARLARAADPKPYVVLYTGVTCAYGWEL